MTTRWSQLIDQCKFDVNERLNEPNEPYGMQ